MKIAVISDIHENSESLKQALREIEFHKCDEIICLGDISGFSIPFYTYFETRNAHECLNLIKANCKTVILGNHDLHAASIIPENCTFFNFPSNWYQMNYQQRNKLSQNVLWLHDEHDLNPLYTTEDIEYLKSLAEFSILNTPEFNILFTHYAYPNISGIKKDFYTYKFEFQQHFKFMESKNCAVSFIAHSHAKGFYTVTKERLKQYDYQEMELGLENICIGIPPITDQQMKSGFCIFDTYQHTIKVVKL